MGNNVRKDFPMANIITCIRIVISVALLFCPALSSVFYELYIAAGFSDMIDGAVARKTGTVSEFGSRLDTFAVERRIVSGTDDGLFSGDPVSLATHSGRGDMNCAV